jgi:hypothetical protein
MISKVSVKSAENYLVLKEILGLKQVDKMAGFM